MSRGFIWIATGIALSIALAALMTNDRGPASPSTRTASASLYDFDAQLPEGHELHKLEEAARKGDLGARLALGKRYASGDGVKKSEARAFAYFESIANQFPDIDPMEPRAAVIAEAFRHLSDFYRQGIPTIDLKPDPAQANGLLQHSASYFGDPVSQFELAKLMLKGDETARNIRIAVGWLLNASRKGYAPAQAMLGDMLWRGEGVKRATGDGLALMAVARENASQDDSGWISALFLAARAQASPDDIEVARQFIVQHGGFLRKPAMLSQAVTPEMLLASEPGASSFVESKPDLTKDEGKRRDARSEPPRDGSKLAIPQQGGLVAMPVAAPGKTDGGAEAKPSVLTRATAARDGTRSVEVAGSAKSPEPR